MASYKTDYITLDPANGETGRTSWVYVFTADKKGKFKCDLIFDKASPALKKLKKLRKEVLDNAYPNVNQKKLVNPIKNGDEKFDEDAEAYWMYENTEYITISSNRAVAVFGPNAKPITAVNSDEFYPGCHAVARINAFEWSFTEDNMTKRGIGFGFNAIQKVKDDEPFSGESTIKTAEEAGFSAVGSGDEDNYDGDDDDDDW
jgi:hypothetical protein